MESFRPLTASSSDLQLLSNGTYHVMVTGTGAGYSRWKQHAVTRWREDSTCDNWGAFCAGRRPAYACGSVADGVAVYKSEPYVVASDVYSLAPHAGRGGWTWYTGSAGWLYRLILESLSGLTVEADLLRIAQRSPASPAAERAA